MTHFPNSYPALSEPQTSKIFLFREDRPTYGTDDLNPEFLREIRDMLRQARQRAYAAMNFTMVETYWRIGQRIVEARQLERNIQSQYYERLPKTPAKAHTADAETPPPGLLSIPVRTTLAVVRFSYRAAARAGPDRELIFFP